MGTAQWIVIIMLGLSFWISASNHGKPETGVKDVRLTVVSILIWLCLLVWGGFFDAQRCAI